MLRERKDVGRPLSHQDEKALIDAASRSRSPALLPLLTITLDTGLRAAEIRALRYKDLSLVWKNGVVEDGFVTVAKSKTEAGTGRTIPFSRRACGALTLWLSRFSDTDPDAFVFPRHSIGLQGHKRRPHVYNVRSHQPVGEWKKAWKDACAAARVRYRWHDLRHTFITRLAERPEISEQTIMSLAGHVSRSMLARYSHIRSKAKQEAIAALEKAASDAIPATESPQKSPQSINQLKPLLN
jgi:integrase